MFVGGIQIGEENKKTETFNDFLQLEQLPLPLLRPLKEKERLLVIGKIHLAYLHNIDIFYPFFRFSFYVAKIIKMFLNM